MKQKHNKTLKSICALMLCMILALTGITPDSTVTADAATTITPITQDMAITMKPGDTKALIILDEAGNEIYCLDYIDMFEWESSDTNVVGIDKADVNGKWCLTLTATGEGTATITGTKDIYKKTPIGSEIRITVTVKLAKAEMTAKQKNCKHKWKVTKKATCQRAGIKTCKKCKWQKTIAKAAHKYVTTTVTTTELEGYYHVYECTDGPEDKMCGFTVKIKCDMDGNFIPDENYKTKEEAFQPWIDHKMKTGHGSWGDYTEEWGDGITTTRKAKLCKWCGKEKP